MKKIISLDALRGYAILLVLMIHIPTIGNNVIGNTLKKIAELTNSGYFGVQIFFVLSGFLITRILLKEKLKNEMSFKRFYIKRFLRIFPIYYLSIIIFGILITWKNSVPVALYISNYWFIFYRGDSHWRPMWSLSVEEHFYLLWPMAIYLLDLNVCKFLIKYLAPCLILVIGLITVFTTPHPTAFALFIRATHFQILSLLVGSFLAIEEEKLYHIKLKNILLISTVFLCFLLIGLGFNRISDKTTTSLLQTVSPLGVLISYTVSGTLILILFLNIPVDGILNKIVLGRPIQFIGKISYGIYLYHYSILYLLKITYPQLNGETHISAEIGIEALLIIFIVAVLSFYVIERPLLKLKDRISNIWFNNQKVLEPL